MFLSVSDPNISRIGSGDAVATIAAVLAFSYLVGLAFLAGVAAVAAGIAVATVRGLTLFRQAKRTGRLLGSELARFDERARRTERLLAESDASARELQEALERLRVSQARLSVLTGALDQASARTRWLRAFLPA